jgi:hypothetical protein
LFKIKKSRKINVTHGVVAGNIGVYLTGSPSQAEEWSRYHYNCFEQYKNTIYDPVVLEIDIPKSQFSHLKPDMEQAEDYGYDENISWEKAFEMSGSVMFDKPVPLSWIRGHLTRMIKVIK